MWKVCRIGEMFTVMNTLTEEKIGWYETDSQAREAYMYLWNAGELK